MLTTYEISLHHCNGKSVDHYCSKESGALRSDPTDAIGEDSYVLAESAEQAEEITRMELEALADECSCKCGRCDMSGSNDWWESVSIVSSTVYASQDVK